MAARAWPGDEDIDIITDCDADESRKASDILKDANKGEESDQPWLLQKDWSLDFCEDEDSRALIQQMLQEEQYYTFGNKTTTVSKDQDVKFKGNSEVCKNKLSGSRRVVWTEEEKQLFLQGMEIYGRSWTKIATLIPTKTLVQVRGYAARYTKEREQKYSASAEQCPVVNDVATNPKDSELQSDQTKTAKMSNLDTENEILKAKQVDLKSDSTVGETQSINSKELIDNKALTAETKTEYKLLSEPVPVQKPRKKYSSEYPNLIKSRSVGRKRPGMISILAHHYMCKDPDERENMDNAQDNCDIVKKRKPTVSLYLLDNRQDKADSNVNNLGLDTNVTNEIKNELETVLPKSEPPRLGNEEVVRIQKTDDDDLSEDCDVDIDASDDEIQPDLAVSSVKGRDPIYNALIQDAGLPVSSEDEDVMKTGTDNATKKAKDENEEFNVNLEPECSSEDEESEEGEDPYLHENEYGVQNYKGEIEYISNPTDELILDTADATEKEKQFHADYFNGSYPQRTPDVYMKIRNHILRDWKKCKPEYLYKTATRNRLKNRGDVNRIGRIFSYLEQIGAINFGCSLCQYNRPRVKIQRRKKSKKNHNVFKLPQNCRKRKVRNFYGEWVDPKDLEGLTVEHKEPREKSVKLTKKKLLYNPFELIPCPSFTKEKKAPFTVVIDNTALVLMDTHSHLSKTEVIGLLGGEFQEEPGILHIHSAEQCDSISTGMQCEMDPVSQTVAAEKIETSGNRVVGWYHSHPTFPPYPSVRDMETQLQFQRWFGKGGHEFIGMIVNPYRLTSPQITSEITCLTVTEDANKSNKLGTPYRFEYGVNHMMWKREETLNKIQCLAEKYISSKARIDMLSKTNERSNRAMTCLEKLLFALRCHIPDEEADVACGQIEDILVRIYSKHEVTQTDDVTVLKEEGQ